MSTATNWKLGEKLAILRDGAWKIVTVSARAEDGINVLDEQLRAKFYSEAQLRKLFADGELKRSKPQRTMTEQARKMLEASLCALPEAQRAHARLINAYIMEFVRRGGKGRASRQHLEQIIADVAAEQQDVNRPSWRTLSDKLKHMKDGQVDLRAVMGGRALRGNRTERFGAFEPVLDETLREYILAPVPSTTACVVALLQEKLRDWNALQKPTDRVNRKLSVRTVQRRIAKFSKYEKVLARQGQKEATQLCGAVGKAPPAKFAMEVVEIDHTVADVFVVHPKTRKSIARPVLTVALDRFSRMVIGFHIGFEEASYKTVMLCLRQAILPKDNLLEANKLDVDAWPCHGRMLTIVMDNGPEFRGAALDDALAQLGVDKRACRTAKGSDKGTVERFLKTASEAFFHTLPGTTFGKPDPKSDYVAEASARFTIAEVRNLFLHWLVREYGLSEHRGINDLPKTKFAQSTALHPLRMPDDVADLDVLLLPAETRTLQREGVAMFGVYYTLPREKWGELLTHPDKPKDAVIKYDPNDLGHIWMLDWRTQRYVKLSCAPGYGFAGMSEREFNVDRKNMLKNKQDRNAPVADDLAAARIKRVKDVKALVESGKGKGRAIARLGDADPDFAGAAKNVVAAAPKPVTKQHVPSPESLPPRTTSRVSFTVNPR